MQGSHEIDRIAGERRRHKRYDLLLDLRWRLVRRRKVLGTGSGRTLDLSSGGILLETDRPLPIGLNLEISIAWPALLNNVAPLQLVVTGTIVRAHANRVALRMAQHEFRTVGVSQDRRAALAAKLQNPPVPARGNQVRGNFRTQ
jgi:hypothetical protein